jgi:hypothetical protein
MSKRKQGYVVPKWASDKPKNGFVCIFHDLLRSAGYRALSLQAKAIYTALLDQYNPYRADAGDLPENAVYLTHGQICEALGVKMSGARIGKYMHELEFFGFIKIKAGGRGCKSMNVYIFCDAWKAYRGKAAAELRKTEWKRQCEETQGRQKRARERTRLDQISQEK